MVIVSLVGVFCCLQTRITSLIISSVPVAVLFGCFAAFRRCYPFLIFAPCELVFCAFDIMVVLSIGYQRSLSRGTD